MNEIPEKIALKREIGRRMKEFRKHLRFTQLDMAPHCGIGRADLSRIEKGEVFPGIYLLTKLNKKFNLSLSWLLLNDGEMLTHDAESGIKKSSFVVQGEELQSLFLYLNKVPLIKHRVLALFYEMKNSVKDQMDSAMKDECSSPETPQKD